MVTVGQGTFLPGLRIRGGSISGTMGLCRRSAPVRRSLFAQSLVLITERFFDTYLLSGP